MLSLALRFPSGTPLDQALVAFYVVSGTEKSRSLFAGTACDWATSTLAICYTNQEGCTINRPAVRYNCVRLSRYTRQEHYAVFTCAGQMAGSVLAGTHGMISQGRQLSQAPGEHAVKATRHRFQPES